MPLDLHSPRPGLTYLRRRLRAGEAAPAPTTVTGGSTPSGGIRLSGGGGAAVDPVGPPASQATTVVSALPVPPLLDQGDLFLGPGQPSARLSRRRSAIGTLAVLGASHGAWETVDGDSGFLYGAAGPVPADTWDSAQRVPVPWPPLPESPTPSWGNRHLVEFHRGALVVNLRHFQQLRRLVVAPVEGTDLSLGTGAGSVVTLPWEPGVVLYLSVVDGTIEMRREFVRGSIHGTFRIGVPNRAAPTSSSPIPRSTSGSGVRDFFAQR